MKVKDVIERLNNGDTLVNLAEEINVCENGLKNALEELEFIYDVLREEWVFKGITSKYFDSSIFKFILRTEETNFTSEQILMLKQIANHHIKEEKIQKLKMEISTEINKLPTEQGVRTKVVINKWIRETLDAFSNQLELRESDIIGVALSHFFDKYKIDKVE
ncbi:hypothetical protein [Bacillus mobilis]|uniref:hypothetical protein n=1 Tax=Bacillus mobilis TaxID=2026190 RepID=UPI003699FC43